MVIEKSLKSENIKSLSLRCLRCDDCTEKYVSWLNNSDINKYLEIKWQKQDLELVTVFVNCINESLDNYLFGIFMDDTHIGNIKLGPINSHYRNAEIGYVIGEQEYWGKGIATEVISMICKFGFEELSLHRISAGAYDCAIGSQIALQNNGFNLEGRLKEAVLFDGKYIDVLRYSKING